MAPARGAQAQGPGLPRDLPRDHPRGDRARLRRAAGAGQGPGRRPGDPPRPGPPLRLRDLPSAVAQGLLRALGRARAVRGHPHGGAARARAHGVRDRRSLGPDRRVRPGLRARRRQRLPGAAVQRGRAKGRHWPRLRRPRAAAQAGGRRAPGRAAGTLAGRGPVRGRLHGRAAGDQALPLAPQGPVHDLHAAAGRRAQAALLVALDHAGGPAPVRERLHHLHANRLGRAVAAGRERCSQAGSGAVGRGLRAGCPAQLREQVQERAGGPRGHPPRRRLLPHPGSGPRLAVGGRVQALRADLAAHRRLADGRCQGLHRDPAPGRDQHRRPQGGVQRLRHRDHVQRLPLGLPRGPGHHRGQGRRGEGPQGPPPAADGGGRRPHLPGDRRRGPQHQAPGPLHGGLARGGHGRARHRASVDLRRRHLHDHRPRLRQGPRHLPDPVVDRVLRGAAARGALQRLRRLRLHGRDGGGPGPHRPRGGGPHAVAAAVLLRPRGRARRRPQGHRRRPRRDRCPGAEHAEGHGHDRPARGQVRPVPGVRRRGRSGDRRGHGPRARQRPGHPGPR